ncbi:hypothetical protein [Agromyces sp. H66]|uniref:hypothetical protein n=1 Tax=Agromyces sp. H66 TaxID=2529859 RepID=UPI0020BD7638|nr:hypothetical protein [Agromyces sp. H66]
MDIRELVKQIENRINGSSAVHRDELLGPLTARAENVAEDRGLVCPLRAMLRRAVKPYLTDERSLWEKSVELTEFMLSLTGELRMQTERGPNS